MTALGLRFLPSIKNEKYPIKVFKDEKDEIMHGIGLKLSSHHVDSAGEKAVEGSCEKASNWAKQEKDYFKPSKHIIADLTHIFGDKIASRYFTDIVDSVLPSYCHKQSLPCGVSSQGKDCISENLLTEMMVDADRVFCDRYIGAHGGFNATRLSIYPFMNEIIENLKVSMDPLVSGEVSRKVTIFSGHDTVISPVLAALGVYKQFCTWPPLASRVVFELWQSKSPSLKFSSSTSSSGKYGAYFVRVLFNGEDIAMKIPACQNEYFRRKNRSGSSESYSPILCPFNVIETIVSEMISPYKTIQEACV